MSRLDVRPLCEALYGLGLAVVTVVLAVRGAPEWAQWLLAAAWAFAIFYAWVLS